MDTAAGPDPIRFGTFELDTRSGELRRAGSRVPLQHQPFEILRALIEYPGRVVSREELRSRLWSNGAYVDFERSLNKAMVKLRDALGDDADSPRFIETLPRRGYRFIADVRPVAGSAGASPPSGDAISTAAPTTVLSRHASSASMSRWLAVCAVGSIVLFSAWSMLRAPATLRIEQTRQLTDSPTLKLGPLLSDGRMLYYSESTGDGIKVMRLPLQGGGEQVMDFGLADLRLFALSPDGSELIGASIPPEVHKDGEHVLWSLPVHGGMPHAIGDVRASSAGWGSDGRIYFSAGSTISSVASDGSDRRRLLTAPGKVTSPRVSPDGRHLRYSVYNGAGRWTLWEADVEGRSPHPLSSAADAGDDACCGEWLPDGSAYLFQSTREGRTDLWFRNELRRWFKTGTGVPERLSSGPMNLRSVLPAADRGAAFAIGEQRQGELVRYDSARGELVPFLGGISAEGASFSRDGNWVAYVSYPDGSLWRSRVDGSDRRQLTSPPFIAGVPVWSPDQRRIVFTGREDRDRHWQTYVVSVDGGGALPVTAEDRDQFGAWWSPEADILVLGGMPNDAASSLRLLDLATHTLTVLPESTNIAAPIWSHDGKRIFAQAKNPERILAFDLARQRWSEVFQGTFTYWEISHDDKYIYFDRGIGSNPGIYRVPVAGGDAEKLVDLAGVRRAIGPFGSWFDLAPDDSPILLRDLSSQQVYALTLAQR